MNGLNWGGNYAYGAGRLHRPASVEEVQEIVADAPRLRVLGSRHSFTAIADSAELLSLDALPADVTVDHSARTVSVGAGVSYGALAGVLEAEGVALHTWPRCRTSPSPAPSRPRRTDRAMPTATSRPPSRRWSS